MSKFIVVESEGKIVLRIPIVVMTHIPSLRGEGTSTLVYISREEYLRHHAIRLVFFISLQVLESRETIVWESAGFRPSMIADGSLMFGHVESSLPLTYGQLLSVCEDEDNESLLDLLSGTEDWV